MNDAKKTENSIDWGAWIWRGFVVAAAVFIVGIYYWHFHANLERPISIDPEQWGQFGDYFGGVLNPLLAFAAFYWLTQSVKIQKEELSKALQAMTDANTMQKELMEAQKIAALDSKITQSETIDLQRKTAEIAAISVQINKLQREINSAEEQVLKVHMNAPLKNSYEIDFYYDRLSKRLRELEVIKNEKTPVLIAYIQQLDEYLPKKTAEQPNGVNEKLVSEVSV